MTQSPKILCAGLICLVPLLAPALAAQAQVVSPGPLHPWPVLAGDPDVRAVDVGDVDGDGRADVVTVGAVLLAPDSIHLHRGLGDGGLAPALETGTLGGAKDLALADLAGNGRDDVLLVTGGGLSLHVSGPGGVLGPFQFIQAHPSSVDVLVGDLDGDGSPDALLLGSGLTGRVLLNQAGSLTSAGVTTLGAQVLLGDQAALADVDVDGDLDLVLPDAAASTIDLQLNDGSGAFGPAQSFATSIVPQAVVVGDTSGDGRPEIVARGNLGVSCVLHQNLGGSSYGPAVTLAGGPATTLVLADLDADADLDLVRWSTPEGLHVTLNPGSGAFGAPDVAVPGVSAAGLRATRLDGDGSADIVTVQQGTGRITVLRGDDLAAALPTPTFAAPVVGQVSYADGDGDGLDDLWVLDDGQLVFAASSGAFTLGAQQVLGLAGLSEASLAHGDVNGDGRVDAVLFGHVGAVPTLVTALGQAAGGPLLSPTSGFAGDAATGLREVALADVDGDSLLDAVLLFDDATQGQAVLQVGLGLGDGRFVPGAVRLLAPLVVDLALGDVDADGLLDAAALRPGGVQVLLGQPGGSFAAPLGLVTAASLDSLELLDVDADGRADLVLADGTSGPSSPGLVLVPSLPGPTFGAPQGVGPSAPIAELLRLDVDRDGTHELLAQGPTSWLVSTAVLNGSAAPLGFANAAPVLGLAVGDLDGNGLPEIVELRSGDVHAALVANGGRAWLDLGAGLGAAAGAPPVASLTGPLTVGSSNSLELVGAPAGGSAFVVLSPTLLAAPFKGGLLVPQPDIVLGGLGVSPTGTLSLPFSWANPTGVPAGLALYAQLWLPLGGGVFVASNAVEFWTP